MYASPSNDNPIYTTQECLAITPSSPCTKQLLDSNSVPKQAMVRGQPKSLRRLMPKSRANFNSHRTPGTPRCQSQQANLRTQPSANKIVASVSTTERTEWKEAKVCNLSGANLHTQLCLPATRAQDKPDVLIDSCVTHIPRLFSLTTDRTIMAS